MIYYPLSVLMLAGIRDILLISTPEDHDHFARLLGDGTALGVHIQYAIQPSPDGLAQAFLIGEEFIGDHSCAMVLGDNLFYGSGLSALLKESMARAERGTATVFAYYVNDPERFGIVQFDSRKRAVSIVEKDPNPKSNYAVTGLYFYPRGVSEKAHILKPSTRGELEITDLNLLYMQDHRLHVSVLGRGYSWLDMGTHESLFEASNFVKALEEHEGLQICCPEEISFYNGWLTKHDLLRIGESMKNNRYGRHLINVAEGRII